MQQWSLVGVLRFIIFNFFTFSKVYFILILTQTSSGCPCLIPQEQKVKLLADNESMKLTITADLTSGKMGENAVL